MSRPKYIPSTDLPYHITARSHNKDAFRLPPELMWPLVCDELTRLHFIHDFQILSFVLMPNHFHMITVTPKANLPEGMHSFMTHVSKQINAMTGNLNQNFGARHFRCLMTSHHYLLNAYKYVYRNPVKAGLCRRVEDYRYSSLQMYLGLQPIAYPLSEDCTLMNDIDSTLAWLNKTHSNSQWKDIRIALKHSEFKLPRKGGNKEPNELESFLL